MAGVHLTKTGLWQACPKQVEPCEHLHMPGVSTLEAGLALPLPMLSLLIEAFDTTQPFSFIPSPNIEDPLSGNNWYTSARITIWYDTGGRHRDYGLPALVEENGAQIWYRNGRIHRDHDLPAVINEPVGLRIWYQDGQLHREGGKPAIIMNNEHYFFEHGVCSRKPLLVLPSGGALPLPAQLAAVRQGEVLQINGIWAVKTPRF
jgi:hypothetical protein